MRDQSDSYYNEMNEYDIKEKLKELNELPENKNNQPLDLEQIRKKLQTLERTRNLLVWLDNSTVANHGYLVCLVTCLYDPAVFYTDAEYRIKTGKTVNIQNIIEQPELHFIARCGSSDSELLLYSETRLACVQELKHDCAQYTDKLRFCHGDSPLRSFEAGQQKGGNYFCATCDVHCDMTYEIDHVLNKKPITLQTRQDCILQGAVARRHSLQLKAKPLKALTKQQLEEELASRRIYEGKTKQELQDLLTREMHGMQRVPALIMNNPKANLKDIGLGDYEILPAEPLHDIGHHIENFLIEYPRHLSTAESTLLDETVELCIGGKDSKRCVDYRTTLVKTAGVAHQSGIMSKEALLAIDSLVEIQRILYSDEHNRSPALILRYYNQCWLHSMTLRNCIVKQPKKLTLRKMFGVYFHNLSSHAGLMLRIISGQAANAEGQERIFNHIKRITKHTSNYHPGQIIPNLFIRLQAEKEMGLQGDDAGRQQAHISKLAQCLPERSNTCIPISMIKKNSREWQAHLQQISDYLVEGEGVWWMKEDEMVEFYDVTKHPTQQQFGPQLHHFRSSNLQHEATHLDQCWAQCIDENVIIPTHLIRVDQDNGSTHKIFTDYLGDELPAATPEPEHVHVDTPVDTVSLELHEVSEAQSSTDTQSTEIHTTDNLLENQDEEEEEEEETILSILPAEDELINVCEPIECTSTCTDVQDVTGAISSIQPTVNSAAGQSLTDTNTDTSNYEIQTHLGKALQVVIGNTKEVKELDQKRRQLKLLQKQNSKNKNYKHLEDKYKDDIAHIQVRVLAESRTLQSDLITWEQGYILKNDLKAPSSAQINSDKDASILLKKLKYAKALLKEWNINFHN